MNKTSAGLLVTLLLLACTAYTQSVTGNLAEISVSTQSYRGDLNKYEKWAIGWQAGIKLNNKKRLNGEIYIGSGSVYGDNPDYVYSPDPAATPSLYFRTSYVNAGYNLALNVFKKKAFRMYLYQGISLMSFTPKNAENESLINYRSSRKTNEGYNNFIFAFPHGIGFMYQFENKYGFGTQIGFMNTRTDYIDNIKAWGNTAGNDNILQWRFQFFMPTQMLRGKKNSYHPRSR